MRVLAGAFKGRRLVTPRGATTRPTADQVRLALLVEDRTRVLRADVGRALGRLAVEGLRFDVVFLDPPYDGDLAEETLAALGRGAVTAPGARVVAQHFTKRAPAPAYGALAAFRTRRFGETTLTFFRAEG